MTQAAHGAQETRGESIGRARERADAFVCTHLTVCKMCRTGQLVGAATRARTAAHGM